MNRLLDDPKREDLAAEILVSDRNRIVETVLQTDDQVIARVTDGIYRQPASALRELISNAYDADATRIVIKTDAPRFGRITVEDDGHGMTAHVLAHLLLHIGGSAKRNQTGVALGIASGSNSSRSPKGRRLIGKIGIGLFSVSQLTHSFQIITKTKGDSHRTIATVALRQFSDFKAGDSDELYEAGRVKIWRERAVDKAAHGTTIVLTAIRPQARDTLRSREIWSIIDHNEEVSDSEEKQAIEPPKYHIGRVTKDGDVLRRGPTGKSWNLPWAKSDSPEERFRKLVNCVWAELSHSNPNPQLERLFDYYLRMIWQLALAVPLPYVDRHLFDEKCNGWTAAYSISNTLKGAAKLMEPEKRTFREILQLTDPKDEPGKFEVIIDELRLSRPIKFRELPATEHALKKPIVFIGKCNEKFGKLPIELSGGPLSFEAYLFWAPKIAPTEHQGSLLRIHGSSGTLFDSTFMRYQVSELTRLRQVTCEIFVSEGLDSALNIDRESFNHAHPHSVYITKWLHSALRQLATAQKRESSEARSSIQAAVTGTNVSRIKKIAADTWAAEADDEGSSPPVVMLAGARQDANSNADAYTFDRSSVVGSQAPPNRARRAARATVLEEKLKAIAQVLASYNLLDRLSKRKQEQLLRAIYQILDASEEA